jgi:hypothetical protein
MSHCSAFSCFYLEGRLPFKKLLWIESVTKSLQNSRRFTAFWTPFAAAEAIEWESGACRRLLAGEPAAEDDGKFWSAAPKSSSQRRIKS